MNVVVIRHVYLRKWLGGTDLENLKSRFGHFSDFHQFKCEWKLRLLSDAFDLHGFNQHPKHGIQFTNDGSKEKPSFIPDNKTNENSVKKTFYAFCDEIVHMVPSRVRSLDLIPE